MKGILLILLAALLLTGCGVPGSHSGDSAAFRQISMEEGLAEMETASDFILVDVRRPDEFAAGHIPGAINIPNESIGKAAPGELPELDQLIYIYCRSGNRSKQAARKLAALGYTNLVEFGGILDYHGEIAKD